MKDAIKAVAATNGGILCGNRVRVELTPIDEEEDKRYHMNARGRHRGGGGGGYRRPRPPSRSPPPPGSPVPRYKRHSSPSPQRYSERSSYRYRDSPVRSRSPVPRHRPRYERRERYQKNFEFHQYETGSPHEGKSYTTGPVKETYRDRHGHDDKYESLNSSIDRSPNSYRDVHYDNEHTHHKNYFPEEFQQSKSHSSSTGSISGRSRRRSYVDNYRDGDSSTWNIDVEGNQQYYYPSSPPSPPPLHSAEQQFVGRANDHYPKFKPRDRDNSSFPNNSRYDVQQDIVYTSTTYPLSLSPPPPPPSPPIPRNEDRSSRRRSSRSREERQKSWKEKESNSDHRHSHKIQRHRSRSPVYYIREQNEYVTSSMIDGNSSVPNHELDEYHSKSRSTSKQYKKALPGTDCKTDHSPLVYEQIEEGTDGFFSEVGYHSPSRREPPKEYIQTVDGREYATKEDVLPSRHHQQPQVYSIEAGQLELAHSLQAAESDEEQFLEIDEVKGNVEIDEGDGVCSRDVGHQLREREVVYSKEREVLRKKHHSLHEREVLHSRKREREVIVKRSPMRNRSRSINVPED